MHFPTTTTDGRQQGSSNEEIPVAVYIKNAKINYLFILLCFYCN